MTIDMSITDWQTLIQMDELCLHLSFDTCRDTHYLGCLLPRAGPWKRSLHMVPRIDCNDELVCSGAVPGNLSLL